MKQDEAYLGTLAQEYHVASRNQLGFKHMINKHHIVSVR